MDMKNRCLWIFLMAVVAMFVVGVESASAQIDKLKFGKYGLEKVRIKSRRSGTGLAWVMTENSWQEPG